MPAPTTPLLPTRTSRTPDAPGWTAAAWTLLGVVLIGRLVYAALCPLDLVADEAYYWDWSRHLDWCYYSKPPLIAWLNALSTGLLGNATAVVRLPAVLLTTLAALGTYLLTVRLAGPRAGWWALVLALAAPGTCALALIMTIDAPLSACWSLALYALWRALTAPAARGGGRWWWAAGLLVLLGVQAKQMMLIFVPLTFLYLALTPPQRAWLRRPGPYLLTALALLGLLPLLWWNMQHDWLTLRHTASHFARGPKSPLDHLGDVGIFLGTQAGLVSPITFGLLLALLASTLAAWRRVDAARRFLFVFCAPALVVMLSLSLHQEVNPNWPLVCYFSGVPLVALWGAVSVPLPGWPPPRRWLLPAAAVVGTLLAALVYVVPYALAASDYSGSKLDVTARLLGWRQFGQEIGLRLADCPRPQHTFVVSLRRDEVAELAFYLPGQPQVYRWAGNPRVITTEYELWPGPLHRLGDDALVVLTDSWANLPPPLAACFRSVDPPQHLRLPVGRQGERRYTLFLARDLRQWPAQAILPPPPTPPAPR